jgi:hypothetical protein
MQMQMQVKLGRNGAKAAAMTFGCLVREPKKRNAAIQHQQYHNSICKSTALDTHANEIPDVASLHVRH